MAKTNALVLSPNAIVEDLGRELIVVLADHSSALKLSGSHAAVIRSIQSEIPIDAPSSVVEELIAHRIISPVSSISRRKVIRMGVVSAGAGLVALAIPSVAAASSVGGGGGGGGSLTLAGFRATSPGGSATATDFTTVTVDAEPEDNNGQINTLGITLPATNGTVTFADNTSQAVASDGTNNTFTATGVTIPITKWQDANNTLTFVYNGVSYTINFPA